MFKFFSRTSVYMNKEIKYKYAIDQSNELVSIDSIKQEDRDNSQFYCLSCHHLLTPVLGQKRQHHFRHLEEIECNGETYLHKLAKLLFKQKFEHTDAINIHRTKHVFCSYIENCKKTKDKSRCNRFEDTIINLKSYFDSCTIEKGYNGFIADILLESTKSVVPPLMVEIAVTHPCSIEKIESKTPIFEITIKNEDDVINMFHGNILDGQEYNFKEFISKSKGPLNIELYIQNFILYKSGKYFSDYISKKCTEQIYPDYRALFQCLVYTDSSTYEDSIIRSETDVTLDQFIAIAQKSGFDIKNCNLCKFCKKGFYDSFKICTLYKKYQTPHHPNSLCAYGCPHYFIENRANIPNRQYKIIVSKLEQFKQIQNELKSIYSNNTQNDYLKIEQQKIDKAKITKRKKLLTFYNWNTSNIDEQIKEEKTKALDLFKTTFLRDNTIVYFEWGGLKPLLLRKYYDSCEPIIKSKKYALKYYSQKNNRSLYIVFLTIDERDDKTVPKCLDIPIIYIILESPGEYISFRDSNGDIIIEVGNNVIIKNISALPLY